MALDGRNGEILWRMHTKDEVYELTCPDSYDVNGDGASDCIASGRFGTFMAFDPRAGNSLFEKVVNMLIDIGENCLLHKMISKGICPSMLEFVLIIHNWLFLKILQHIFVM